MFRRKTRTQRLLSGLNGVVKEAAKSPTGKEIKKAFRGYSKQLASMKMPLKITISR